MVVVLSPDSLASKWVDDEVGFARSLEKKIIPLCYRPCDPGLMYVNLHRIDVQGRKYTDNFNQILRALNTPAEGRVSNPTSSSKPEKSQAGSLTYETPALDKITLSNGMEFMRVPAGKFLMGSNYGFENGKPKHTVDIPYDYWMARYPVTNGLYNAYAKAKWIKHPVDDWQKKKDHPVVLVSWKDAMAYCRWLNNLLKGELPAGLALRLPTEAEWEKAARGTNGMEYPWGNQFDINKCNTVEGGKRDTTPVGLYSPQGDSLCGCADMSGNVLEWTHSLYKPYPYQVNDGREDEKASGARALRGGSFVDLGGDARCAYRDYSVNLYYYRGFRVVVSPVLS